MKAERFLTQRAAPVEVAAARAIAGHQMLFVAIDIAGESARDRAQAARVERFEQYSMRHQAGDTAVSIQERMNP